MQRKRMLTIVAVVFGLIALLFAFDVGTASPRLCMSCHEMASRAGSWEQSGHATVTCVKCHQQPRPWYALPLKVVDRGKLLTRDTLAHLSGAYDDPVETRTAGVAPMPDEVCLQCHSPNRTATSGYRILIDHAEHAKRNGSCVSCHVRTAHPEASRGTALTLMAQCFTCHGTPQQPDASAECGVCHPAGYELLPSSHEGDQWKDGRHGDIAGVDVSQCGMCHEKRLCDSCHGVEMPHPPSWIEEESGHSDVAERDPAVCVRCHNSAPSMCTMCHHESYDTAEGSWLQQHGVRVNDAGAAGCIECHGPLYCVDCHIGGPG